MSLPDLPRRVPAPLLVALVAVGGAVGGVLRLTATTLVPEDGAGFAATTWTVNLVGSFLLGALVVGAAGAPSWVRPLVGTGLLGGFTTFSAVAHTLDLTLTAGDAGTALAYAAASVVGGVLAAALGAAAAATLVRRRADRRPAAPTTADAA